MTEPKSWLEANAAKIAIIPIAGLLIGTIAGVSWAIISGADELRAIWIVVNGSLVGSFLGMGAAMVVAGGIRNNVTTVRGLTWMAFVTAVLLVFWLSIP